MDDDEVPHRYDDGNRAFLQAFLARGTLTFKEAQPILAAIFSALDRREHGEQAEPTAAADVTLQDFESYVGAASAAASPFDMEIRSIAHQATRERVYALVNTTSDPVTQLATLHSAEEIAFVRRVIDAMFDKYNTPRMEMLCIDGMQANKLRSVPRGGNGEENGNGNESTIIGDNSNENGNGEGAAAATQTVGGLKGLKSSEVENVLRSMVESGWFERSRAGFYSLSPRALMELRSWLTDAYNDADVDAGDKTTWQRVKFCEACREVVTVGQRCAERDCLVRMHDACAEAFWRGNARGGAANGNGNGGGRACPRCSREWTGRNFVGERAVTETEAYQRGKRRSGRGGGRTSIVEEIVEEAQEGEGEEEEDADGDEDEDVE